MKKRIRSFLALILAAVLLAGCSSADFDVRPKTIHSEQEADYVSYESMVYERPDMDEIEQILADACDAAQGEDTDAIIDAVFSFYYAYDWFYTNYYLADLRYCADLTDAQWEAEYDYCVENSTRVDAGLEELYYALAASPCRKMLEKRYFGMGFFDSYDGENAWDAEFTALLEEESRLQSEYYEMSGLALDYEVGTEEYYDACADDMAGLLVELIRVRQQIAEYWGCEDYVGYAWDFYYYRDYTPEDTQTYLQQVRQELVPLYRRVADLDAWDAYSDYCGERETLRYVRTCAENMGGTVAEAFARMEDAGLYDIAYGENKYNTSFELYLTSYQEPFVFMNPTLTVCDQLTLAHEFGHFCSDYASGGSYAGVDVQEFFSQGLEYLSLCYGEDTKALTRTKMADSLCTYVEQAAYASFEQRMYALEEPTVEALYALYDEVALEYGFDSVGYDRREFVDITHFYDSPLYVISYVFSNDAAMQLYQMEKEEPGEGLRLYEENLTSEESWFLAFLEDAGLESPFARDRITQVRQTFEEILE